MDNRGATYCLVGGKGILLTDKDTYVRSDDGKFVTAAGERRLEIIGSGWNDQWRPGQGGPRIGRQSDEHFSDF